MDDAARLATVLAALLLSGPALATPCARVADQVTCADGRAGLFRGDEIAWSDGSVSRLAPHPSVRIARDGSVRVGPGVFVGDGRGGKRPLDDPATADSARCAELDGVSYCN